jgi:transcriptional regulator with XRE-family HTH domain
MVNAPNNLKVALEMRGWQQKRLARRMHLTPACICRIANGNRRSSYETRQRISRILNCDPHWLFPGPPRPPRVGLSVELPLKMKSPIPVRELGSSSLESHPGPDRSSTP